MHATPLLLRVSTALVLTVASVETLGPIVSPRGPLAPCPTHLVDDDASPRGAFRSLAGDFLVATEAMPDPTFAGTVLYVLAHDVDGALALVLNRPLSSSDGVPLHDGGPVGAESAVFLHSTDRLADDSIVLEDGIALTVDGAAARAMLLSTDSGTQAPRSMVFFAGYAGWGPLQLDGELREGVWRTTTADAAQVFAAAR